MIITVCSNYVFAETRKSSETENWFQIGDTQDKIIQMNANSFSGYKDEDGVLLHSSEYRFIGKVDKRLNSNAITAIMVQKECDKSKGSIKTISIGSDGKTKNIVDTYVFDLSETRVIDAVAKTMCEYRKIIIENKKHLQNQTKNFDNKNNDDKLQWKKCAAYAFIFRAESIFAGIKYNEKILMRELQYIDEEKKKNKILAEDENVITTKIYNEVKQRFATGEQRMKYLNQRSINECGRDNKL